MSSPYHLGAARHVLVGCRSERDGLVRDPVSDPVGQDLGGEVHPLPRLVRRRHGTEHGHEPHGQQGAVTDRVGQTAAQQPVQLPLRLVALSDQRRLRLPQRVVLSQGGLGGSGGAGQLPGPLIVACGEGVGHAEVHDGLLELAGCARLTGQDAGGLHHLVAVLVAFGDRAFVLADLEAVCLALVSGEQAGAYVPAVVGGPGQLLPLRVDGVEVGEWGAARGE